MASDLETRYPRFSKEIKLAREHGYSDAEITEYLRKKIFEATDAGFSNEEIEGYLKTKEPGTGYKDVLVEAAKGAAESLWEGIKATPEVALSMATGAVAYPLSVLGGIAKNITAGPEEARKTEEEIARTFTYSPTGEVAQETMELLGKGMEFLSAPAKEVGKVLEKAGFPQAGYSAEKALEFLTFSILGEVLPKVGKALSEIDVPLVKRKVGLAKRSGYSEAEIAKYLEKNIQNVEKPAPAEELIPEKSALVEELIQEKPAGELGAVGSKPALLETPVQSQQKPVPTEPQAEVLSAKPQVKAHTTGEVTKEVKRPEAAEQIPSKTEEVPAKLYAGTPINELWKSWLAVDRGILGDFIHKALDDTAVDRFFRRFADSEGMRYLPLKNKDNLLEAIYGPEGIKGRMGRGERITKEFLDTLSEEIENGLDDAMFIRYMEDPKYRTAFDMAYPDNPLRTIQEDIKTASENLAREGIITVSQHKAWGPRYLSRVYLGLKEPLKDVGGANKIKAPEIKKGRAIASIMDLPVHVRNELGFVEDAKVLLPLTRFKQYMPSAVNAFAKRILEDPVMVFRKEDVLVKLPEGVNEALFEGKPLNFPEYMSPYYAKDVILPALKSLVKENILELPKDRIKAFVDEIKAKSAALENLKDNIPSDYVFLPKAEGYGNLAGLPVSKDVQNVMQALRVIQNPAELASKLDKYVTAGLATFKVMKVPFAFPTAALRNFLSNYPQWVISGASPTAAFKEIPRAIRDISSKSKRWETATDAGLFKSNWYDNEVSRIVGEITKGVKEGDPILKIWGDIMKSSPVQFVGELYGLMDDIWRMARFNYALDVEKLPVGEAVIKVNKAHYDYSLTYPLIQAMRDPNILKSPAWKVMGSVFPTFPQKMLGLLYQALKDNPATTIGALYFPFLIKKMVEEQQRRKHGKKYDILSSSIPEWQKDPDTVAVYDPIEKKLKIVHLDWILPWGQWVSIFDAVAKGNIGEAVQDVGGMSSPLLLPHSLLKNEDVYTGREIYDPTQTTLKQISQILGYVGEKAVEPGFATFLRRVLRQRKSATEVALRSVGIPYFEYDEKDLMQVPAKKLGKLNLDISMRAHKLTNDLQRGFITKEEYASELKRLYEYQKREAKKLVDELKGEGGK